MRKWMTLPAVVLLLAWTAGAATLNVPAQYPTIQAGINAAVSGDTVLVAIGTYTGTGNKNLDFGGRNLVLKGAAGPQWCIINCQNSGRGFYFHSGETAAAVVEGFTVMGGSSSMGGGMNITNASPTIRRCIIYSCASTGSYGGGAYVSNGSPYFAYCTVANNTAQYGGAMYATNTSMVVNTCIISGNLSSG